MKAIVDGKIVMPGSVLGKQAISMEGDRIREIADTVSSGDELIDAGRSYMTPGFIDVHSDRIEQFIQPRPTSQMEFELALRVCERELCACGITTIYHSMSLMKDELFGAAPLRTGENVRKFADSLRAVHDHNHLIHRRVHLRVEIDNLWPPPSSRT